MQADAPHSQRRLAISLDRHRFDLRSGAVAASVLGKVDLCRAILLLEQLHRRISMPAPGCSGLGVDLVCTLLESLGLPPHRVELTLPSHRLVDCGIDTLLALSRARDTGLGLALAGVRLHHLPLLARLPVSAIILHPALTVCLLTAPAIDAEVAALVIAAQTLGLGVVAPAIDSSAQRDRLVELGVEWGEGELLEQPGRGGVTCLAPQRATAFDDDDRPHRDHHPGTDRGTGVRQIDLPQ